MGENMSNISETVNCEYLSEKESDFDETWVKCVQCGWHVHKNEAFCTQLNLIPSHHGPTRGAAQLDHVLIHEQYTNYENLRYMHTLTFTNLYSDHRAVAI